MRQKEFIRGDKLRELMLLVYLNNRYGLGTKIEVFKLKQFLGYSRSGLHSAVDESDYFVRKGDEITLSEKGERYVRKQLMQQYRVFTPFTYFFVVLGAVLFVQWYLATYYRIMMLLDWYVGPSIIIAGLFFKFALAPMTYWYLKIRGKV